MPRPPDQVEILPREGGRLTVRFPWSAERVARIRSVPGRRWHPDERVWSVPRTDEVLRRLRTLFDDARIAGLAEEVVTRGNLARIRSPLDRLFPAGGEGGGRSGVGASEGDGRLEGDGLAGCGTEAE